jgi:flagellin
MSYLLTNASALTALQNLTNTQNSLSTTQSQLSTGLKVANASDNSSYWSIAQHLTSDNGALGAVSSALSVSSQLVSTNTSALTQAISVVNKIKDELTSAQATGADLTDIGSTIGALQGSLKALVGANDVNGQNYLSGDSTAASTTPGAYQTQNLISGYTEAAGVTNITINTKNTMLIDANTTVASKAGILDKQGTDTAKDSILTLAVSSSSTAPDLKAMLTDVETALKSMNTAATTLGAATTQIDTQQTFLASMQTNLTNSVGSLVDADMNQVSTRLQALQTQQQLGVQSLSIANQSSQMILKLFQ